MAFNTAPKKADPPVDGELSASSVTDITKQFSAVQRELSRHIYGKSAQVELVTTTLLAGGHLLIEDVPGVGKTTLAVALAGAIGGSNQRIQFTSDLLPSDVIGVPIYNQQTREFEFKPGPIFANIVLADEINRTTPKTQSCMLEAMQEGRVSVDRTVHKLPLPFMVIATQNPVEHHGTYPLPESQLDRFMMRISIGYPDEEFEREILKKPELHERRQPHQAVCSPDAVLEMQNQVGDVRVDDALTDYILAIAKQTRSMDEVELGVSTRATLMLNRAAQAHALIKGRDYVTPDDIKTLVKPVFSHRLLVRATFRDSLPHSDTKNTADLLLDQILSEVEVPR